MEVTSGFIAFFPFSFFKPHYLHSIWEKHWINPGAILPLWVHIVTRAEIGKYWQRLAKNTLTVLGRHRCRWEAKLENDLFLKKKNGGNENKMLACPSVLSTATQEHIESFCVQHSFWNSIDQVCNSAEARCPSNAPHCECFCKAEKNPTEKVRKTAECCR